MKCTICGAEILPGTEYCNNCGTKVSEMGTGTFGANQGQPMGQQPFGSAGNFGATPVTKSAGGNGALLKVIAVVVVFVLAFVFFYVRNNVFRTKDLDGFSVDLPMSFSQTDDGSDFKSGDSSGETYGTSKMDFTYVKMSIAELSGLGMTDQELVEWFNTYMSENMGSSFKAYKVKETKSTSFTFTYTSDDGEDIYAEMRTMKNGDYLYMMICRCLQGEESKYSSKFSRVFSSIKFK